jgi:hypothetical protein
MDDSGVTKINRLAVRVAFAAIALGMLCGIAAIWLPDGDLRSVVFKLFWSAVVVFLGAGATMCTVTYFYTGRARPK